MLGMPPSLDRAAISSLNRHAHSPQPPPIAAWASHSLHSLFCASCNRHRHPCLTWPPSLVSRGCHRRSILSWPALLLLRDHHCCTRITRSPSPLRSWVSPPQGPRATAAIAPLPNSNNAWVWPDRLHHSRVAPPSPLLKS